MRIVNRYTLSRCFLVVALFLDYLALFALGLLLVRVCPVVHEDQMRPKPGRHELHFVDRSFKAGFVECRNL